MQFTRKRKRGQNQKIQRSWYSEEGYRISWRKQVHGVAVPARYAACVRSLVPNYSGKENNNHEVWDFVDRNHRLFKTLKAAEEACEKHCRLWSKACDAGGIRALQDLFGKLPTSLPLWARKKMNRKAIGILLAPRTSKFVDEDEPCTMTPTCGEPNPNDYTETLTSSVSRDDKVAHIDTPVSPASGKGQSTPRKTRKIHQSDAKPAAAPAKARAKHASKRTAKPPASGKRKSKNTTISSKSARKPSKGSRTKKSKPSAN